jgi:phosphotransferase system enzyme I (PtsI)
MNHLAIPRIKRIIREATLAESKVLLEKALSFNTAYEVRSYVQDYMMKRFPDDFQCEDEHNLLSNNRKHPPTKLKC